MRVRQHFGSTAALLFIVNCLGCTWSQPLPELTPAQKPSNQKINATPPPANTTERVALSPNARTLLAADGLLLGAAIQKVQPVYPLEAQAKGTTGEVKIRVTIDQDGSVAEAIALSGHALLQAAALTAVKQWRWRPMRIDTDGPVCVRGTLTFTFPPHS